MKSAQIIEADWTYTPNGFESGLQVEVDDGGRIARVGRLGQRVTLRLREQALLPGFVNAHSHAFQRGLRGRGDTFPAGAGSFWTWRQAMYSLVESLDESTFFRLTLAAFREMRAAGTTTVGEFHYLHHSASGDDFALDESVLRAADRAGIRLVLLQTYYRTGGVGRPLEGGQTRFRTTSPARYWESFDALAARIKPATQSMGAVAHSLRAATPDEIAELHAEAGRRGLVFHLHVEEQRQEIADCIAAYGKPPMAILLDTLPSMARVVAVHCTHTERQHLERFVAAGGRVCVCPTTEGNLGDGLQDFSVVAPSTGRDAFCLGSDSNLRISPLEEARWLELAQRLRGEARGVLRDAEGQVGRGLLHAATAGGAAALGVEAGAIVAGRWADFLTLDLNAPALSGSDETTLLDSFIFGGTEEAILSTAVGGAWQQHRAPAQPR
ncbi:MAG: formimidoylglutamate deiminase [Acidobacteriota bacterium]